MGLLIIFTSVIVLNYSTATELSDNKKWWLLGKTCKEVSEKNKLIPPSKALALPGCKLNVHDKKNGFVFIDCRKSVLQNKFVYSSSIKECKKLHKQLSDSDSLAVEMFDKLYFPN